jgi:hypothetical protein
MRPDHLAGEEEVRHVTDEDLSGVEELRDVVARVRPRHFLHALQRELQAAPPLSILLWWVVRCPNKQKEWITARVSVSVYLSCMPFALAMMRFFCVRTNGVRYLSAQRLSAVRVT